jgi:hypothetical protein
MAITRQGRKTADVTKNVASRSREQKMPSASNGGRAALSEEERRRMIAEAAYYRALRRGFAAGGEMDDWLAAEREINQS